MAVLKKKAGTKIAKKPPVVGDGDKYDWRSQVDVWNAFLRRIGYLKEHSDDVGYADEA